MVAERVNLTLKLNDPLTYDCIRKSRRPLKDVSELLKLFHCPLIILKPGTLPQLQKLIHQQCLLNFLMEHLSTCKHKEPVLTEAMLIVDVAELCVLTALMDQTGPQAPDLRNSSTKPEAIPK